jgi:hypothetical protein
MHFYNKYDQTYFLSDPRLGKIAIRVGISSMWSTLNDLYNLAKCFYKYFLTRTFLVPSADSILVLNVFFIIMFEKIIFYLNCYAEQLDVAEVSFFSPEAMRMRA